MQRAGNDRTSGPSAHRPRSRWSASRLGDAVLGKGRGRQAVAITLLSIPFYVAWSLLYVVHLVPQHLMTAEHARILLTFNAVGLLFYPCVRTAAATGRQLRMVAVLQVAYGIGVSLVDYLFIASLRPAALNLVCCAFIFSVIALKPRAVVITGLCVSSMLAVFLSVLSVTGAYGYDGARDGLGLVFSIITLLALTDIGRRHSAVRQRAWEQKRRLRAVLADIERLATRDPLTGLHNRRHAETLLREAVAGGQAFTLALIDLDDFKRVNDRWGHAVGDAALCAFADAANTLLRSTDVVARWGGEEFLLLMPHAGGAGMADADDAEDTVDRLRHALSNAEVSAASPGLRVAFSAGLVDHQTARSWEEALELADQALYAAKAAGKGCSRRSSSVSPAASRLETVG